MQVQNHQNTGKILVVDDDPISLEITAQVLRSDGHKVDTAASAAIEADLSFFPEVIILDIMMPEVDGLTFLTKLRSAPETSKIKVILLTAKNNPEDRACGLQLGADDYLRKPCDNNELCIRVRNQLRRLRSPDEPAPVQPIQPTAERLDLYLEHFPSQPSTTVRPFVRIWGALPMLAMFTIIRPISTFATRKESYDHGRRSAGRRSTKPIRRNTA